MSTEIRQRNEVNDAVIIGYFDEWTDYVLSHRGIDHPFLNKFADNGCNKDGAREIFKEFYYFIHHLPFYIAGMSTITKDEKILREIVINVAEEVGGREEVPHLQIYRDFLEKIGVSRDDLRRYTFLESTRKIDSGVERLYTKESIEKALGAMYALETMSSVMVTKLNSGLEKSGFDENVREFFILHIEGEKGHSNGAFNAIVPYLGVEANRGSFEEGVKEFMCLIEQFWDGVTSLRVA